MDGVRGAKGKFEMEKIVIDASKRDVLGKKVGALRREGKLPAVIYGAHLSPIPIVLDYRTASRIISTTSSSSLVTINVDGVEHNALIREKQRDTIRGLYKHIDFLAVSMTETLRTPVSIVITGAAPAVALWNGIMNTGVTEVEIECLPKDLPEHFSVDVSHMENLGDQILVKDLPVPEGVTILTPGEELVVVISHPAGEEVEEVEGDGTEPEVIEKGKKEEDEEAAGK